MSGVYATTAMPRKWAIAALLIFILAGCTSSSTSTHQRKVYIGKLNGKYTIYRNDQPFLVKGAAGTDDLLKLRDAGGNTIRTWDTTHLGQLLDSAYANNIAVIAGLSIPPSIYKEFYEDTAKVAAQYNGVRDIVTRYKSHPALLMWCLGNEVDFPYRPQYANFYRAYNRLLKTIHEQDPDHPVTTALVNFNKRCLFNIRLKVSGLDLISMNIFGDLRNLHKNLDDFSWWWDGPFLITEWGINGPWESEFTAWGAPIENTSTKKAAQYQELYEQHMPVNNPRFLGACIFYWGNKQEVTHTWYSLFSADGAASATAGVMQYLWTGNWPAHKAPELKYMLLGGKGARDNIICLPDTLQTAEVFFQNTPDSSLRIEWELLAEDWYSKDRFVPNTAKPASFNTHFTSINGNKATFRTPSKEGPYRIFATVYNKYGQFAATNTPFYVIGR